MHLLNEESGQTYCGMDVKDDSDVIALEESLTSSGRHFDCKDCLFALREGQKHSRPREEVDDDNIRLGRE